MKSIKSPKHWSHHRLNLKKKRELAAKWSIHKISTKKATKASIKDHFKLFNQEKAQDRKK